MLDSSAEVSPKAESNISPLEWYRQTESARNVLNAIITTAAKLKLKESRKSSPDQEKLAYLTSLYQEAQTVSHDSERFESIASMERIVLHYGDVLKNIR